MTWQPKPDAPGERVEGIAELERCLVILYKTPLRSVPHAPWLGSEFHKIIDKPMPEARRLAPSAARQCVERCEPRITIQDVTTTLSDVGRLRVLTKWRPTTPIDPRERVQFRVTAVDF